MAPTAISKYVPPDLEDYKKFSTLKKSLIKEENIVKVIESWDRVLSGLEKLSEEIKAEGSKYIPSVDWQTIKDNGGKIPQNIAKRFEERGAIIVRGVVEPSVAEAWKASMANFVTKHPEIGGYPEPDITNWFAFWTKGEVEARSHPEVISVMKTMSEFFHLEDETLPVDKESTVVYPDAFRIRPPGKSITLDLHLDSGSIERWEDEVYRELYSEILEGRWEDWDPWKLDKRAFAKCDLYSHLVSRPTATSAFRALQGWIALSSAKAGEGTIRLLPNLKLANAYSILRPFFWKDNGEIDLETPKFPGAIVGSGQFFCTEQTHPHLNQFNTVQSIDYVNPGDYVFWHCDLAHEVDKEHIGKSDSSVFFNAYCPLCPYNIDSLLDTKKSFEEAKPPRDFVKDKSATGFKEGDFQDHGARKENIISDEGLRAMGFKDYDLNEPGLSEGQIRIRKMANEAMKTNVFNEL